MQTEMQT